VSVVYSLACITARLAALSSLIDAGASNGLLVLLASGTVVASISLAKPSATANGGVLNFNGMPIVVTATGTGNVTSAQVTDSNGRLVFSDASVGIPGSAADVVISTGDNSTNIAAGNTIQVLAMQITGS
jgi:hypothetical protein